MNKIHLNVGDLVIVKKIPIWCSITDHPRYIPRESNEFNYMLGRIYEVQSMYYGDRFSIQGGKPGYVESILFPFDEEYIDIVFTK